MDSKGYFRSLMGLTVLFGFGGGLLGATEPLQFALAAFGFVYGGLLLQHD